MSAKCLLDPNPPLLFVSDCQHVANLPTLLFQHLSVVALPLPQKQIFSGEIKRMLLNFCVTSTFLMHSFTPLIVCQHFSETLTPFMHVCRKIH